MTEPMKVLAMWEPWASAHVRGPKDYENRGWPCPTWDLGRWVLIQSAKKWDAPRARAVLGRWQEEEPETFPPEFAAALRQQWQLSKALRDPKMELCRYGHIIGAVRYDAVLRRPGNGLGLAVEVAKYARWEDLPLLKKRAEEIDQTPSSAPWFMGTEEAPYGWHRTDRLTFNRPVPVRGLQKLWTPSESVQAQCRAELEEAAAAKGLVP